MQIIFIRNIRKRILITTLVIFLWITALLSSNALYNKNAVYNITINDCLTFNYPFEFQLGKVYINEKLDDISIETNSSFNKPSSRRLKDFDSIEGGFSFNYPAVFTLNKKDIPSSDILYHIDFHNRTDRSQGFVQVWDLPASLEEMLGNSIKSSNLDYKYFNSKKLLVGKLPGYYWDYSFTNNDRQDYKGMEVFFKKDNRMFRISYFMPEKVWSGKQANTFWDMVNSFEVY